MAYTVHQTKTHFSRILREVEAGKEVIVMRGRKPVAQIVPIEPRGATAKPPFRLMGAFRGKIQFDDSVFAPAADEDLIEMGFDDLASAPSAAPPAKQEEEK